MRRLLSLLTALLLALSVAGPAAAANSTLSGTVSWRSATTKQTGEATTDSFSSTEKRAVTLKVRMTKRKGAAGWQPEDNGSSYQGSYALASTRQERDGSGALSCTTTHAATISAGGKLPTKPRSTSAPSLFGSVLPNTASLGTRTKAIALTPNLQFKGRDTVTTTGSGLSPCQSSQDVNPVEGSLAPTQDARQVCLPTGVASKLLTPQAGMVVGAFKRAKRSFSFACAKTYEGGDGEKVVVSLSGTLKLR